MNLNHSDNIVVDDVGADDVQVDYEAFIDSLYGGFMAVFAILACGGAMYMLKLFFFFILGVE